MEVRLIFWPSSLSVAIFLASIFSAAAQPAVEAVERNTFIIESAAVAKAIQNYYRVTARRIFDEMATGGLNAYLDSTCTQIISSDEVIRISNLSENQQIINPNNPDDPYDLVDTVILSPFDGCGTYALHLYEKSLALACRPGIVVYARRGEVDKFLSDNWLIQYISTLPGRQLAADSIQRYTASFLNLLCKRWYKEAMSKNITVFNPANMKKPFAHDELSDMGIRRINVQTINPANLGDPYDLIDTVITLPFNPEDFSDLAICYEVMGMDSGIQLLINGYAPLYTPYAGGKKYPSSVMFWLLPGAMGELVDSVEMNILELSSRYVLNDRLSSHIKLSEVCAERAYFNPSSVWPRYEPMVFPGLAYRGGDSLLRELFFNTYPGFLESMKEHLPDEFRLDLSVYIDTSGKAGSFDLAVYPSNKKTTELIFKILKEEEVFLRRLDTFTDFNPGRDYFRSYHMNLYERINYESGENEGNETVMVGITDVFVSKPEPDPTARKVEEELRKHFPEFFAGPGDFALPLAGTVYFKVQLNMDGYVTSIESYYPRVNKEFIQRKQLIHQRLPKFSKSLGKLDRQHIVVPVDIPLNPEGSWNAKIRLDSFQYGYDTGNQPVYSEIRLHTDTNPSVFYTNPPYNSAYSIKGFLVPYKEGDVESAILVVMVYSKRANGEYYLIGTGQIPILDRFGFKQNVKLHIVPESGGYFDGMIGISRK